MSSSEKPAHLSKKQALEALNNNGWYPIHTAPMAKGRRGKPHRIIVTRAPANGMMPLNVVWWGKLVTGASDRGWKTAGGKLQYEPTHWRPMLDPPVMIEGKAI